MKKTVIYIFGILVFSICLTNCGSSKKGCGLTSDANKIEQSTTVYASVISEAK